MPKIIRLGDTSDHGGQVITAAQSVLCEGKRVARKGDLFDCPVEDHGVNPIIEGSSGIMAEGKPVARQGHKTQCGASLISGATHSVGD